MASRCESEVRCLSYGCQGECRPRACSGCGRPTWLAECCRGFIVVEATVHLARESPVRKGAFHLICRGDMRGNDFRVTEEGVAEVNCGRCLAILEREVRSVA